MLSRTADNLYWTGRYMERAENLARVLDVSYRNALLDLAGSSPESEWRDALASLGNPPQFTERRHNLDEADVTRFFTVDIESPCSIKFCVRAAREKRTCPARGDFDRDVGEHQHHLARPA